MSNIKKNIEMILKLPGNSKCADCASVVDQDTGWASLNLGVTMCIQCAGIHRAMGVHITKIRSFRLDTNAWTDKITDLFKQIGGNDRANNAVWESNLPTFWINPKIDTGSDAIRQAFVRAKYEKQAFLPPDNLNRVNLCIRKMPIEVRQQEMDFWPRNDKKWKNKEFGVIHSRWLSRYSGAKKSKANKQYDLTSLRLIVEENTSGFEEYDGYEFSLYEDNAYITNNTKEADMYFHERKMDDLHNTKDAKRSSNNNNNNNDYIGSEHEEPLVRCRVKDFKKFCLLIQEIRSTISYYRVYDTLYEVESDPPNLQLSPLDLQNDSMKALGFAKMGWSKSKRWFCTLNGFLYQFKEDVSQLVTDIPCAVMAWDLQVIDCVLDEGGKRSGSKYAVLLIVNEKTISLKFSGGPEAVKFYSSLKQSWTSTRGRYAVNFVQKPPIFIGEAAFGNSRDSVMLNTQKVILTPTKNKKFFGANGGNTFAAATANGGGDVKANAQSAAQTQQDALILKLLQQYDERKAQELMDLEPPSDGDDNDDDYEESSEFQTSEDMDENYNGLNSDNDNGDDYGDNVMNDYRNSDENVIGNMNVTPNENNDQNNNNNNSNEEVNVVADEPKTINNQDFANSDEFEVSDSSSDDPLYAQYDDAPPPPAVNDNKPNGGVNIVVSNFNAPPPPAPPAQVEEVAIETMDQSALKENDDGVDKIDDDDDDDLYGQLDDTNKEVADESFATNLSKRTDYETSEQVQSMNFPERTNYEASEQVQAMNSVISEHTNYEMSGDNSNMNNPNPLDFNSLLSYAHTRPEQSEQAISDNQMHPVRNYNNNYNRPEISQEQGYQDMNNGFGYGSGNNIPNTYNMQQIPPQQFNPNMGYQYNGNIGNMNNGMNGNNTYYNNSYANNNNNATQPMYNNNGVPPPPAPAQPTQQPEKHEMNGGYENNKTEVAPIETISLTNEIDVTATNKRSISPKLSETDVFDMKNVNADFAAQETNETPVANENNNVIIDVNNNNKENGKKVKDKKEEEKPKEKREKVSSIASYQEAKKNRKRKKKMKKNNNNIVPQDGNTTNSVQDKIAGINKTDDTKKIKKKKKKKKEE